MPTNKSVNTRQKILDVSARWLREKGLAFTSMADIAQVIGVKTSSIYYHFDSKDTLIAETLNIGIEMVHTDVEQAVNNLGSSSSHQERLHAAILAHLNALLGSNDYSAANILNYAHAPPNVREQNRIARTAYGRYWASLLEAAQRDGKIAKDINLSSARMLLIGALNWAVEWFDPKKGSLENLADDCFRLFIDGIGHPRSK